MIDQVSIGRFISSLRKEKKLTQEQLAEGLGVNNRSVSRWENKKIRSSLYGGNGLLMIRYVTYSFHISDIISLEAANSATGSFLLIKTEKEEIKIEAESPKAAAAIAEELKNVMK